MRYIKTTNNLVEFIEASNEEKILSVRAFQFGELYFQIKNGKVTFYLNDQENPWRNDVWTINIPFELDGVEYDNEGDASAALSAIMNDSFQKQLDELKEDLAEETAERISGDTYLEGLINAEVERSTNKDTEHDALISGLTDDLADEIANRISGDTYLEGLINAEVERSTEKDAEHDAAISDLTDDLNDEILRSTNKDTEHDALISGLTDDLAAEVANRISGDTNLQNQIDTLTNRVSNDEARLSAEEAKNAEQDAAISGLNNSLNTEIQRATSVENSLRNDLTNETSARTAADAAQLERIVALENNKANKSDVYTKQECDAKYATKEYVSGNTYTKAEITTMLADKADKINAVSTALYNSQSKTIDFKNIYGNVIASVDARDFIKDGMVDNAEIINNNLVITFNTDAGKEAISVSLTDIFDPNNYYNKTQIDNIVNEIESGVTEDLTNYYTKSEVDASQAAQDAKINAISGDVQTLSGNTYTKSEVNEIVNNIESGITQDLTNYYTKSEVDASQAAQDAKINAISGDVITLSGKVDTISGDVITLSGKVDTISGDVITLSGEVATISGDAISSGEVQTMIDNNISGKADKTDIYTYVGTDRIKVSTTAGVRRKAIDLNLPIYNGNGTSSLSLSAPIGTTQGANQINGGFSTGIGWGLNTKNPSEVATGQFNISHIATNYFGDSGNTLFSVGNGDYQGDEHNALEIHQNGDIYISSGGTASSPMIKLQDHLGGGGGGGVTPSEVQQMINNSIDGKTIDYLSAGTNVSINNNVISAVDTKYTAGNGIAISNSNVISTVTKFWCGNETEWSQISGGTLDANTIYMVH